MYSCATATMADAHQDPGQFPDEVAPPARQQPGHGCRISRPARASACQPRFADVNGVTVFRGERQEGPRGGAARRQRPNSPSGSAAASPSPNIAMSPGRSMVSCSSSTSTNLTSVSRCSLMRLLALLYGDTQDAAGLGFDRAHGSIADATVGRQRVPQERVLGMVLVVHGPHRLAHAVMSDHLVGEIGRLLQIVLGSRRQAVEASALRRRIRRAAHTASPRAPAGSRGAGPR